MESCNTCKYWIDGNCRRYPPRGMTTRLDPETDKDGIMYAQFSTRPEDIPTPKDYWCGEWQLIDGVGTMTSCGL